MSAEQSGGQLDPARDVLALRFQLQYADVEAFVRSYAGNVSPAGMFIASKELPAVGTALRFEVVLADERPILRGEGQVLWTAGTNAPPKAAASQSTPRAPTAGKDPDPLCGLGVRFSRLDAPSRAVLAQVLAYKAAHPAQFFTAVPDPYASPGYQPTTRPLPAPAPAPTPPPPSAPAVPATAEPLPTPAAGLPTAAPPEASAEEAALQSLLQPSENRPLPTATDAARLLDALLGRRPG